MSLFWSSFYDETLVSKMIILCFPSNYCPMLVAWLLVCCMTFGCPFHDLTARGGDRLHSQWFPFDTRQWRKLANIPACYNLLEDIFGVDRAPFMN